MFKAYSVDPTGIIDPKTWAEFGVTALTLGAAILLIWFLLREHKSERKENQEMHREERKEWFDAAQRQSDEAQRQSEKVTNALDRMSAEFSRKQK